MDFQRDLEEYKRTCIMGDSETDKTIVIHDLDQCRYIVDHISVKELPENERKSKDAEKEIALNVDEQVKKKPKSVSYSPSSSTKEVSGTGKMSQQFSQENDMDLARTKVYDFEMSKIKTLPAKISAAQLQHLNRKWVYIAGLAIATLSVIILVIVVLVLTSSES